VISYPLRPGKSTNHIGGLIDRQTHQMIDAAVLLAHQKPRQKSPILNNNDLTKLTYFQEDTILYGGILYSQFGHFLVESLCRLWAYKHLKDYNISIGFYVPWRKPRYFYNQNFVNQILRGFGIPLNKIRFLDEFLKIKRVIVPAQKYGFGLLDKPDLAFLNFLRSFEFKLDLPQVFKEADKIYVSRSKLPISSGQVIASHLFEEYLADNGYAILYPENYSLYQQLSILKNAKKIIFCDGSAVHSCILLPDLEAQVAVISRRKDPLQRNFKDTVAQFKGLGKTVLWIDSVVEQYQLGMAPWDALSYVDWHAVSRILLEHNFVEEAFTGSLDKTNLVRREIKKYVGEILDNPSFIDFIINQKELFY
jgi:capsular polysaccharide biosynthesis protein